MLVVRHQLIEKAGGSLSPGPFFVTRKGSTTYVFHGGLKRWRATQIGFVRLVQYKWWKWALRYCGEILGHRVIINLKSEKPTFLIFRSVAGHMIIDETETAEVRVWRPRPRGYRIHIGGKDHNWSVHLVGERTPNHDVRVEIFYNDVMEVSAPSRYETWAEGVWSFGGFVRYMWGDWLVQCSDTLPIPGIVACICCIALNNGVLGDVGLSDPM